MEQNITVSVHIVDFGFMNIAMILKTKVAFISSCILVAVLLLQHSNSGKFCIN